MSDGQPNTPSGATSVRGATGPNQKVEDPSTLGQVALEIYKLIMPLPKDEQARVLRATAILCGIESEVKR